MKCGVITFPGSNCDQDLIISLKEDLGKEVISLWHKDTNLQGVDLVLLPGGFSYGDYLRSGAIARFSPIMKEVVAHAERGGYLLGICNGFQMLTEAGLLEGVLLRNQSMNFICDNIWLTTNDSQHPWPQRLSGQGPFKIPIAHAEGNYFCSSDQLKQLSEEGRILFQYCDSAGNIHEDANPNGSLQNIAGIANKRGNVIGMMPHPERATDAILGNTDGKTLLEALFKA